MSDKNWNMIVCKDLDNGIGKSNIQGLSWNLPEDLKLFRKRTTGHIVIMGRKTLQSMGKPLPKRDNIVLSRNYTEVYDSEGNVNLIPESMTPETLYEFLKHDNFKDKTVWVIGGSEIYNLLLPFCNKVYVTEVLQSFGCDIKFPVLSDKEWIVESTSETYHSDKEGLNYCYVEYLRIVNNVFYTRFCEA